MHASDLSDARVTSPPQSGKLWLTAVSPIQFSNNRFFKETRAITRILYRGCPGRRPVFPSSLPLRTRGDGAPGGAAVVVKYPHSPSGMRKRLPARHPNRSLTARAHLRTVFFRFALSRKRTAPGRAFRFGAAGLPAVPAVRMAPCGRPLTVRAFRQAANRTAPVSQLLAGGSYWPPGGAPAPPECLGGAFVSRPRTPHPAPSSDAS